jgi:hypothetical protein
LIVSINNPFNGVNAMNALKINRETAEVKKSAKRKAAKRPSKKSYTQSEKIRVGAFASVALCGLAVSLPHLATEIELLTGASPMAAWFLAVVIDIGMIVTKAHLSCSQSNWMVAYSVVGACTGLSILLNSHAFYAHANCLYGQCAAIIFGAFLPLFILALSYLASEILNRK